MMHKLSRRRLLVGSACIGLTMAGRARAEICGKKFGPWKAGGLDIHHIDTGRGNATFIVGPDATTFLIDCGASNTSLETTAPPRPNGSRTPGEWVVRYIKRHAPAGHRDELDYLLATHVHPDHIGDVPPGASVGQKGYVPTGLSEVDDLIPARHVIDRAFPEYGLLTPPDGPFSRNYFAWLASRMQRGLNVESARVGTADQLSLRNPRQYPQFAIRVLAANGHLWTGEGNEVRKLFPDSSHGGDSIKPKENASSIALKLSHGKFSYYTGGDLNFDSYDGRAPWLDVETPVAKVTGQVEVATANHHGYFDAVGPEFVRSLNAQAYIVQAWHLSHPGPAQIERMLGNWAGAPGNDVFALEMLPINRAFNSRFVDKLKSTSGHVVIRVAADGETYNIYVLDSTSEDDRVKAVFGPYHCRD